MPVELEVMRDPEAAAQRLREEPGARRRADQRERLERDGDHARMHARIEREVDAAVLHRGIDVLLDRGGQAVDLVDEEDIVLLHLRERADEVARLRQRGAAGHIGARTHFVRDHMCERRLAEAGRSVQQHMLHRLAARLRRRERDREPLDERPLSDILAKRPRTDLERLRIEIRLGFRHLRRLRDDALLRHARRIARFERPPRV